MEVRLHFLISVARDIVAHENNITDLSYENVRHKIYKIESN